MENRTFDVDDDKLHSEREKICFQGLCLADLEMLSGLNGIEVITMIRG